MHLQPPSLPTEPAATGEMAGENAGNIGRYRIVRVLGSGGMGVVLLAEDADLDRKVAIKLLRPDLIGGSQSDIRQVLLREAQAMARVSHPNVVAVYEAGSAGDELFVAMELIDGGNLRQWLHEGPHTPAEVLAVFLAAGRGLAAVHHAGMVHRDFKPENVLFGSDGRVRVGDFGLAGVSARAVESPRVLALGSGEHVPGMTMNGRLIGTPGYMAPEQIEGTGVEASADQYAFCVSLAEALTGQRPAGAGFAAPGVAPHLRAALARGLAADPASRWPSMDALLAELARDPAAQRRKLLLLGAAVGVGGLAAFLALRAAGPSPGEMCGNGAERLAGVWDAARRADVNAAFLATGQSYAEQGFLGFAARLDAQAAAWTAGYQQACEATHVRGEQSAALLDLRMACLEGKRRELDALVDVYAGGLDATALEYAQAAASGLSAIADCDDGEQLARPAAVPAAQAAEVARLQSQLDRGRALLAAGKAREALAVVEPAALAAEQVGHAPLRHQAQALLGRVRSDLDDAAGAEQALLAAIALAGGDDVSHAGVLVSYAGVLLDEAGRIREAVTTAQLARAVAARSGDELTLGRAELVLGRALIAVSRFDEARAPVESGLAALERHLGPDHPELVSALLALALQSQDMARIGESVKLAERALAIAEKVHGPDHPQVAAALQVLGSLLYRRGKTLDGAPLLVRALAIVEKAYGPESVQVGKVLVDYIVPSANAVDGLAAAERARAILERELPADHPLIGRALMMHGHILKDVGRLDEARPLVERGITVLSARSGPLSLPVSSGYRILASIDNQERRFAEAVEHFRQAKAAMVASGAGESLDYGRVLAQEAEGLRDLGRCREALPLTDESMTVMKRAKGPETLWLALPLSVKGQCHVLLGEFDAAFAALEPAVAMLEKFGPSHSAITRAWLARALWARGEKKRALDMADAAAVDLAAQVAAANPWALDELKKWRRGKRP